MRIRTIKQAIRELKEDDPNCSLTLYSLTKLVKDGTIPSIHKDRFYLVDLDFIKNHLGGAV